MRYLMLTVLAVACSQAPDLAQDDQAIAGHRARVLDLDGDLHTHDPSLIQGHDGHWYVFSTGDPAVAGGTIQVRRSTDLHHWVYAGNVFDHIPDWALAMVPGATNIWAPEVKRHDGTYYLYYAVSTPGQNTSVIGLATSSSLAGGWVDQGLVTATSSSNDYNAIDPAVIDNGHGTPYLALGSFWSGIRMFQLEWPSGKLAPNQTEPLRLADRFVPPNAIEAASLTARGGYFYLFASLDFCCQGVASTYKIAVGRSTSVTGPYYDRLGTPLEHGGGTVVLSENGTMFGPGGESVSPQLLAYHWYDAAANGDFRLGIRTIEWSEDGWPSVQAAGDDRF